MYSDANVKQIHCQNEQSIADTERRALQTLKLNNFINMTMHRTRKTIAGCVPHLLIESRELTAS